MNAGTTVRARRHPHDRQLDHRGIGRHWHDYRLQSIGLYRGRQAQVSVISQPPLFCSASGRSSTRCSTAVARSRSATTLSGNVNDAACTGRTCAVCLLQSCCAWLVGPSGTLRHSATVDRSRVLPLALALLCSTPVRTDILWHTTIGGTSCGGHTWQLILDLPWPLSVG